MADVPQTVALLVLAQNYGGDIVRQINRKTSLLRLLPIVAGEGKNVAWAAEKDGALAEEYAEGADAEDFGSDGQDDAILSWAQMRATARITGLAAATSRTSKTPLGNLSLLKRNIVNSAAALASLVNQRCYSGNGAASPKQVTGLNAAIGTDDNTYATINRATSGNEFWQPTVIAPGSPTSISFALIRDDLRRIYEKSGEMCDLAMVSPAVFNEVGNLFDANRRYVQEVTTARGTIKLDAGKEGIEVDGCVFVKDKDATAGQIYYLNSNYVHLEVLPPSDEVVPQLLPGTALSANDGFGELPLMFTYEMLAKTGDSKKMMAKVYTELCVKRPNACGVRKNVAYSA
jgi:hypothetical protein